MAKRKYRTEQERQEVIRAIEARVKAGENVTSAVKAEGISDKTWYNWKARNQPITRKYRKKSPSLLELPLPSAEGNIMLLWGKASDVNQALEKIARIQNG